MVFCAGSWLLVCNFGLWVYCALRSWVSGFVFVLMLLGFTCAFWVVWFDSSDWAGCLLVLGFVWGFVSGCFLGSRLGVSACEVSGVVGLCGGVLVCKLAVSLACLCGCCATSCGFVVLVALGGLCVYFGRCYGGMFEFVWFVFGYFVGFICFVFADVVISRLVSVV